jgi:FkbM family methyltransferase
MSVGPMQPGGQAVYPDLRRWARSLPVIGPLCRYVKRRLQARRISSAEISSGGIGESWMKLLALPDYKIFVDRGDGLIGREIADNLTYETHVTTVLRRLLRPGQGFLDVGANIGFHTLLAARRVGPRGRVIAVEMMPRNCELLRASLRVNGFQNVTLHEVAAAEKTQTLRFTHGLGTGNGMLVNDYVQELVGGGGYNACTTVQAAAIDDLVPAGQPIHLVKMDIEGAEMRALQGMRRLLESQRPQLIFEYFPHMLRHIGGIEPAALLHAVRAHGYDIRVIERDGRPVSDSLSDGQVMGRAELVGEHEYLDLLAVPRPAPSP